MPPLPSITFLIGGKFSRPAAAAREPRETDKGLAQSSRRGRAAPLRWYMPCEPAVYNLYRFGSEHWGDLYGDNPLGAIGLDGERYFAWDNAGRPTYANVRIAADRLLDRCRRLRHEFGVRRFRFVGHSAGCFVANVAMHHADFDVHQLILCSPSVPRPNSMPGGWSKQEVVEALPCVERLASGTFFYFYVQPDTVLAYLRRDTNYSTPYVEREFPAVFAAARTPGPIRTVDLLLGHWRTVRPRTWTNPPNLAGQSYLEWIAQH